MWFTGWLGSDMTRRLGHACHAVGYAAEAGALLFSTRFDVALDMETLRAIHRLLSANSVTSCAVFLAKPQYLTCVNPNGRSITRNGCATLARMPAFTFSTRSATKSGSMNGLSLRRRPRRMATCQIGP